MRFVLVIALLLPACTGLTASERDAIAEGHANRAARAVYRRCDCGVAAAVAVVELHQGGVP